MPRLSNERNNKCVIDGVGNLALSFLIAIILSIGCGSIGLAPYVIDNKLSNFTLPQSRQSGNYGATVGMFTVTGCITNSFAIAAWVIGILISANFGQSYYDTVIKFPYKLITEFSRSKLYAATFASLFCTLSSVAAFATPRKYEEMAIKSNRLENYSGSGYKTMGLALTYELSGFVVLMLLAGCVFSLMLLGKCIISIKKKNNENEDVNSQNPYGNRDDIVMATIVDIDAVPTGRPVIGAFNADGGYPAQPQRP